MNSWHEWSQEDIDRLDYHRPWWQWKLTRRGEIVMTVVGLLVFLLLVWGFIAIAISLTGTEGVQG